MKSTFKGLLLGKPKIIYTTKNRRMRFFVGIFFVLWILNLWTATARAEGSKDLVENGGDRPFTEWSNESTAQILRQTLLRVFVKEGETVNLGSSVHSAENNKDIIYRNPFGIENSCDVKESGEGFIDTLEKESAGPLPNSGGYEPCQFTATETGIYEVEFRSPDPDGSNPPTKAANEPFPTNSQQRKTVAAWDITVRDEDGNDLSGRVFTTYVAMNMGNNSQALSSIFYIQTKDGFLYRTEMNGLDPFGFIFFANSRGFIDKTDNSTLYHSAKANNNELTAFQGNVQVQRPDVDDTATDITHLVFFNQPDPETLIELNIPTAPVIPQTPTNFKFTGGTGGSGNQTFVGIGGYFSFDSVSAGSYEIIIDTDEDGIFDPSKDRVLQNIVTQGNNVVLWDGQDAEGNNLLPRTNNNPYDARIRLRIGEYHFPMLDPEKNPNGLVIEMLNAPGPFPVGNEFTIYYDDEDYITKDGTEVTLGTNGVSNPPNAATGIDSRTGKHEFTNNFGDQKGIDTWAYFPSEATSTNLIITTDKSANVRGTKSVSFLEDKDNTSTVTVGDTVEYTITYSNKDSATSDATDFVIEDNLPSQLTFIEAQIVSQTDGNNIQLNNSYNGSGALTESNTLQIGDEIVIKITATINDDNDGNPISNQAQATFNTPDNPATTGTALTDADSNGATEDNPSRVGNGFKQTDDDGENTGNDPSETADDDATIITVEDTPVVSGSPKILLVKRITAINGNSNFNPNDETVILNTFIDDTTSPNQDEDNHPNWASDYLKGAINGGLVKSGDEIEYTIYFLSTGDIPAKNVLFCDRLPASVSFIRNSFNNQASQAENGLQNADRGISWLKDGNEESLTNNEDGDLAQYFEPNDEPSRLYPNIDCDGNPNINLLNTNGAIVVNLQDLTNATGSGIPNTSYGFIRFKTRVISSPDN